MDDNVTQWDTSKIIIIWIIVVATIVFVRWDGVSAAIGLKSNDGTVCVNVTSYDHNWNNDMKCTRPDGSTFYTSYDGAKKYR